MSREQNINDFSKDLNLQKGFLIVCVAAIITLVLKLMLSYSAYGTNDITYWKKFSDVIAQHGSFKLYSIVKIYNHPPLISWILKIVRYITIKSGLSFQFVFRLMPIIADFFCIFVIWSLLSALKVKNRTFLCVICSINPINFLISGFHGNTDPVFVFFIFLVIYFIKKKQIIFSGLCYGLCLCVKIVPIILLPVFFFYFRKKKEKAMFIVFSAIIPVLVYLPYLLNDFHAVTQNIFAYKSLIGIWGIPRILRDICINDSLSQEIRKFSYDVYHVYNYFGKTFLLLIIIGFSKFFMVKKNLKLTEGCFLVFGIFLSFTAGFGVQYLSWLSYFAVITVPWLGMVYLLIGGFFLFRVYVYWGGGVYPYYANSDVVGKWIGFNKTLDIVLWITVVIMLINFLLKSFRLSGKNQGRFYSASTV